MSVVAIYNMKGGVGKTTTAVNLSYLAAAGGQRALLWDLDPQGASSFAFRIRPRVAGFGRKSLESGDVLSAAIKETDYQHLDLLPADFTYRKIDRLLDDVGKPERVLTALLETFRRDYDVVFLDCPAGFSLLTEGVFAAADVVLVPAIPTVLSLRMVARLLKWADRTSSRSELAAFFSMVDRRKALHRRVCEWSAGQSEVFLTAQVPYASVVEQIAVRRMPLAVFAARDPATTAFAGIWAELQTRVQQRTQHAWPRDRWARLLQPLESLIDRLEWTDEQPSASQAQQDALEVRDSRIARGRGDVDHVRPLGAAGDIDVASIGDGPASPSDDVHFVHRFDTDRRDLERGGYVLELHERVGSLRVVAARVGRDHQAGATRRAEAQIDNSWATQILSGVMSPLGALESRLGRPAPDLLANVRAIMGGRTLRRIESRVAGRDHAHSGELPDAQTGRPHFNTVAR